MAFNRSSQLPLLKDLRVAQRVQLGLRGPKVGDLGNTMKDINIYKRTSVGLVKLG